METTTSVTKNSTVEKEMIDKLHNINVVSISENLSKCITASRIILDCVDTLSAHENELIILNNGILETTDMDNREALNYTAAYKLVFLLVLDSTPSGSNSYKTAREVLESM